MKRKWLRQTMRRLTVLILVFGLTAGLRMAGSAATVPLDMDRECAVSVNLPVGVDEAYLADLEQANVVIDIYKIADAVKVDGYDTYTYEFPEGSPYAALAGELTEDGQMITNADWQAAAQQASEIALGPDAVRALLAEGDEAADEAAGGEADVPVVSGVPVGSKSELENGLYLLIARGRNDEDYISSVTDEEDKKSLVTVARTARYEYAFAPQLVSLPSKEDTDGDGVISTADGEWIYDLAATLKPMQNTRYGSLEIVKQLEAYETSEPATFVFRVTAVLDDEVVYDDVTALTYTAAGQRSVLLDRIPAGSVVTVEEIYSGSSYTFTSDGTQTAPIEANATASVQFTNTYDGHLRKGYGVTNHFSFDEENDGWNWEQWEQVPGPETE